MMHLDTKLYVAMGGAFIALAMSTTAMTLHFLGDRVMQQRRPEDPEPACHPFCDLILIGSLLLNVVSCVWYRRSHSLAAKNAEN